MKRVCHWNEDGDGSFYATDCGRAFSLNDGTPEQNDIKFCCYCGLPLKEEYARRPTRPERRRT